MVLGTVIGAELLGEFRYMIIVDKVMTQEVEPHILEQYHISKKIGSGAYGHVWKVTDKESKQVKALKKNFDAFSNSTDAQRTYREIMFLRQLRHPNIIGLEKVIRARNDKDIYLVFEHMDIDLHTLVRENSRSAQLQERHKQYIIHQVAKAIFYLHHSNLIHRDIKPSNILINENCEAKLCDFGLVRFMEEPPDQELVVMTDYIATRWYRAPELLLGSRDYNKEVDMWALGCLIAQIFNEKALFPGTSTMNQIERVVAWTGPPITQDLKQLGLNIPHNVMQLMTTRKKLNRRDFLGGKATASCLDLISRLLEFNPSKRLTIEEVLKHEYLSQFYDEKEMKLMRSGRAQIQLHINDNTKLSLKDYRELIYNEIAVKKKLLNSSTGYSSGNTAHTSQEHSKSKNKGLQERRKQVVREKSRTKTLAHETESKCYTFESTHSREEQRPARKDIKSSMEKSTKSRADTRKKGISLCSKSMSKNHSLSRKQREYETGDNQEVGRAELVRRTKLNSRSCSEKYEKGRRPKTQEGTIRSRKGILADCFVNQNIGKKLYHNDHR